MKNIFLPLFVAILFFSACKKDKTSCYESIITLTYDTYSQFDSTYTFPKACMTESQWESTTFESSYDPITGQVTKLNEAGTFTTRYYDNDRSDSVTRVRVTTEVSE